MGVFITMRWLAILALVLAGWQSAASLHQPGPVSAMVICGEGGARTVYVDARGHPSERAPACQHCPDCTAAAGFAPAAPDRAHRSLRLAARVRPVFARPAGPRRGRWRRPLTRGPPAGTLSRKSTAR
jgi:hypothetical protein